MSVCLFVCLSIRLHISKTTRPDVTKFSVHVTCGRGSVLLQWQCDKRRTSGYVDDIIGLIIFT